MTQTRPEEEIARAIAEAVTGARATTESSVIEGRDQITTLLLDWDGCPGGSELPERVNIRVGPYGDYVARFEEISKPFASGLAQETLMTPASVLIGVRVRVTDAETFQEAMEISEDSGISAADLEAAMLRLPVEAAEAGIDRIRVSDVMSSQDDLYFEVSAEVSDPGRLVRAARNAYLEAWWDNTWIPCSPNEALFELALGSNANRSPDEMGFEFVEFPDTRQAKLLGAAADREVSPSPNLVPDAPLPYADWLELTGRDDSFVGNGLDVPGSRDLYAAALRALPRPDLSGPEPD